MNNLSVIHHVKRLERTLRCVCVGERERGRFVGGCLKWVGMKEGFFGDIRCGVAWRE